MPCLSLFRRRQRRGSFQRTRRPSVTSRLPGVRADGRRRLPVLPPEVVLHIFAFAAQESASTASTLARLCSQTRDRVRLALYTEPTLTSARQINLFLRTVKRTPDIARLVVRLRLDGGVAKRADAEQAGRSALTTRLAKLLELCPALEALELRGVVAFSLTDFANARQLRHLALVDTLLSDRTTTSRFTPFFTPLPSLRSLTLQRVQLDGPTAEQFLSAHTLPQVTALSLEGCRLVDDPVTLRDLDAYSPLGVAEQLEVLYLTSAPLSTGEHGRAGVIDPYDLVERCTSLQHLALPIAAVTAHVLEATDQADVRPQRFTILAPPAGEADPFDPHLAAAQALSTTFLTLATTASSSSPGLRSSPLALAAASAPTSFSALSTPAASRAPSPGAEPPSFLGGLRELVLPASWDRRRVEAWKGNGEFAWAVARVVRECERRGTAVRFVEEDGGVRSAARTDRVGWKGEAMLREMDASGTKGG